jgi:CheY-like chemotaxis protein
VNLLADPLDAGKVLIVDDEYANIAVVSRVMGRLGYETATAADGEAALDAVVRERPDIVLLDVNMPLLDGFEVCRRRRLRCADHGTSIQDGDRVGASV